MVQPMGRLGLAVEHLVHTGQTRYQVADPGQIGAVADVDVSDLVVGDGERPRRPRVQVLHAFLGVDLQQAVGPCLIEEEHVTHYESLMDPLRSGWEIGLPPCFRPITA